MQRKAVIVGDKGSSEGRPRQVCLLRTGHSNGVRALRRQPEEICMNEGTHTDSYLLLPPRPEVLPYTEFSRELCCELCSLLLPASTTCFIDSPPQGSPESSRPVSMTSGSGDAYALPARLWFSMSRSASSFCSLTLSPTTRQQR
jgi:hypothetical protein